MSEKQMRNRDLQTITVTLGKAEILAYDQARQELGINVRGFIRLALKFFLWVYQTHKKGAHLKVVYPDNREVELEILELEGAITE